MSALAALPEVALLTPAWTNRPQTDPRRRHLVGVQRFGDGWTLTLALQTAPARLCIQLPVAPGDPEQDAQGNFTRWGLRKLGPGTWVVSPSWEQQGLFHAYVIVCEAPDPAPWEI